MESGDQVAALQSLCQPFGRRCVRFGAWGAGSGLSSTGPFDGDETHVVLEYRAVAVALHLAQDSVTDLSARLTAGLDQLVANALFSEHLARVVGGFEDAVGVAEEVIAGEKGAFLPGVGEVSQEAGGRFRVRRGQAVDRAGANMEDNGSGMAGIGVGEPLRDHVDNPEKSRGEYGISGALDDGHQAAVDLRQHMHRVGGAPNPGGQGPVIVNAFCNFYKQLEYPGDMLARHYVSNPGRSSFETWITLERVDQPGVIYAAGGATTVWTDFPTQKSTPLPDWLRLLLE